MVEVLSRMVLLQYVFLSIITLMMVCYFKISFKMLLFPIRNRVIVVKEGTSLQADCLGLGPVLVWLSKAPMAIC